MPETDQTTFGQATLQRLLVISAEILGQLDLDPLLESIMTGAAELLDASQINLYRYVAARDLLETWIRLRAPTGVGRVEHRRGDGAAGTILETGRGLRLDDYDSWQGRSTQWPKGVTGPTMAVPLRRSDTWLGVLTVSRSPGARRFDDSDLALLQLFANQAAVAIANAQLYAQVSRRARELSKLHETSLDIVSQLDMRRVLEATLERATDLLESSANLRLYDARQNLLVPLIPLGQPETIAHHTLQPGEGLSGRVFVTGEPMLVNDYDTWEGRSSQYPKGLIARAMAAPLRQAGETIGVVAVDRPADQPPYTDDDLRLLSLFANQASVAVTNARQVEQLRRFHQQQIEKERLDAQLRTAQAVQAGLLPPESPSIAGWEVAALWRPALELGGDYYDFLALGPDRWGFVIADVSDKGVPAALLMAVARTLFRAHASADIAPSEVLNRINRDLVVSSHSGMFVTALYAVIDTASGRARVSAAGHPPALVIRTKTGAVDLARPPGVPLGILAEASFSDVEMSLGLHDRLVLYTDGVTEASTSNGDQFGPDRLWDFLRESASLSSMDLVRALEDRLRAFAGETGQSDDIAAVALTRVRATV